MVGRMTASTQTILPAPLYYRALQFLKNRAFQHSQSFKGQVPLNQEALEDLSWWLEQMRRWNSRQLKVVTLNLSIEMDASLLGWDASA